MDASSQKPGKCCCSRPTPSRKEGDGPGQPVADPSVWHAPWVIGKITTAAGDVPQISTSLTWADHLGGWRVRWAIGRMHYRVAPGLYAVGSPNDESPVLVTANYKLSFDSLRSQLLGRDAWILVLDTKGVNVWCAAAKGTFGTDELIGRIEATNLAAVVNHNVLVVPQLGAVGVSAHEVHKRSGFRVVFGPVYASDLPAFLDAGFKSPEMGFVHFVLWDRLVLVPVELAHASSKVLLVAVCLLLLAGLGVDGYSMARITTVGVASAMLFIATATASIVLGPALLPWLPGRAFAYKGMWLGLMFTMLLVLAWGLSGMFRVVDLAAWGVALPAVASFLTMTFTGATPFTSLSGVRREMRLALPLQIGAIVIAVLVWTVGRFV